MSLKQLPLPHGTSVGRRAAADAVALGRPKSLAGTQVARQLDIIDGTFTTVVEKKGLAGLAQIAKRNPGKTVAAITGAALAADWAYEELVQLASSNPEKFSAILEQVDQLRTAAHLGDETPAEDGQIGPYKSSDTEAIVGLYEGAKTIYARAVSAARGEHNLRAIMEWIALDDDLKQMVLNNVSKP